MSKLLIFLFFIKYLEWAQSVFYKPVNLECFPKAEYIANATCKLKAIDRYRTVANMECDIRKTLRNISLHLQIFRKDYANHYKPFLVNVTNNICDILDKKRFPVYATIVLKIAKEMSNVNHTCPYSGHIIGKNIFMDQKYFPPPVKGTYKVVFRVFEGFPYKEIGTVIAYAIKLDKN